MHDDCLYFMGLVGVVISTILVFYISWRLFNYRYKQKKAIYNKIDELERQAECVKLQKLYYHLLEVRRRVTADRPSENEAISNSIHLFESDFEAWYGATDDHQKYQRLMENHYADVMYHVFKETTVWENAK